MQPDADALPASFYEVFFILVFLVALVLAAVLGDD